MAQQGRALSVLKPECLSVAPGALINSDAMVHIRKGSMPSTPSVRRSRDRRMAGSLMDQIS